MGFAVLRTGVRSLRSLLELISFFLRPVASLPLFVIYRPAGGVVIYSPAGWACDPSNINMVVRSSSFLGLTSILPYLGGNSLRLSRSSTVFTTVSSSLLLTRSRSSILFVVSPLTRHTSTSSRLVPRQLLVLVFLVPHSYCPIFDLKVSLLSNIRSFVPYFPHISVFSFLKHSNIRQFKVQSGQGADISVWFPLFKLISSQIINFKVPSYKSSVPTSISAWFWFLKGFLRGMSHFKVPTSNFEVLG